MNRTTGVTQVLLIGGASLSGKTSVSYRLANHFNVGITEVDDFQVILERMTTPEQQPELHWDPRTLRQFFDLPMRLPNARSSRFLSSCASSSSST